MEIMKVESEEQVLEYLKRYDASAVRKISDRVKNMELYSEKLCKYGENYVVWLEGKEVGFFSFYNNDMVGKKAYLTLIALDMEYQRMKLGSQIIQFICGKCRDSQMKTLGLEVDKMNEGASSFYIKQGFHMAGDASEDSFYMEKEI